MSGSGDDAKRAGRGFLWVAGAKGLFVLTAFGVTVALPVIFGDEATFGRFAVVFGAASLLNNVLIASTIQTVSKLVSEAEDRAGQTLRQGLRLQLTVGLVLGGGLLAAAPWIASGLYHDPARTPLLRVAGGVVLCYALYAALVGNLNGLKRFDRQARLDMTFSVLRTGGLLGGAALGIGALGAFGGFGIAAALILLIALVRVGIGEPGSALPWGRWRQLLLPIVGYQLCLNGLLLLDLQVLNVTAESLGSAAGLGPELTRETADRLAAFYSAAQRFAFVPYQSVLAVTFIVFPFVSKATATGDDEAARRYVRAAFRFSLLQLLMVAAPIAGAADGVLLVAFPDSYVAGADALRVLIGGQVCFALFVIGATILTSSGRATLAVSIAAASLVVVVIATSAGIRLAGVEGNGALAATAAGTSLGTTIAFAATGFAVYRIFGALIPVASALRGSVAAVIAYAVAHFVPHGGAIGAVGALAAGASAYLVTLVITREVGREDLALVRRVMGRG